MYVCIYIYIYIYIYIHTSLFVYCFLARQRGDLGARRPPASILRPVRLLRVWISEGLPSPPINNSNHNCNNNSNNDSSNNDSSIVIMIVIIRVGVSGGLTQADS